MKSTDVVATGGADAITFNLATLSLKGIRVIPIIAGATWAQIVAAYAGLTVTWTRLSQARTAAAGGIPNAPAQVTDAVPIFGPDWIRSPGFGATGATLTGVAGITYRIVYAEDCMEIVDTGKGPMLDGFTPGVGPSTGATASYTAAQSSTANIPSAAGDGVNVSGCRGVACHLSAGVGQTIATAGLLVWWRYNGQTARWSEGPIQVVVPTGRRDACAPDELLGPGVDRVFVEWRSGTLSAGGSATLSLVAQ